MRSYLFTTLDLTRNGKNVGGITGNVRLFLSSLPGSRSRSTQFLPHEVCVSNLILVLFWFCSGSDLVQFWFCSGSVLVAGLRQLIATNMFSACSPT